jgi:biotin synthase
MTDKRGVKNPDYNCQNAVDDKYQVLTTVKVTNVCNDDGELSSMKKISKKITGQPHNNTIGDCGYSNKEKYIHSLEDKVINREEISPKEAYKLLNITGIEVYDLLCSANHIRDHYKGNRISLCAIINAKSGKCSENCAFCAQSSHHKSKIKTYPLVDPKVIVSAAERSWKKGAQKFSVVTSGKSLSKQDIEKVCVAIKEIHRKKYIHSCASLGILTEKMGLALKEAGLECYHHNLETAESYFSNICTTHYYEEDITTVKIAKNLGFKTCCGGIFGMGESVEKRVELAFTLKNLGIDSVPVNFLNPIPGTMLEGTYLLTPIECLKILAVLRFILPSQDIITCGGREQNIRSLQSLMFLAGANGTMIGNYLTTDGRDPEKDLNLIRDLGLSIR